MTNIKENKRWNFLIIDDEANIRKMLVVCLEAEGYRVTAVGTAEDAIAEASGKSFDIAFVDLRLGTASGLDLIPALLATSPWLKVIVITAYASIDTAVEAVKRGATDYIAKPFTPTQVRLAISKVLDIRLLEQKVFSLEKPEVQGQVLSLAARAFQNRYLLKKLDAAGTPGQVYGVLSEWDK